MSGLGILSRAFVVLALTAGAARAQAPAHPWLMPDILAAAKAEGQLTVYSSTNEQEGLPLWKIFEDATGIKINYVRAADAALMGKIALEARSGQQSWDLINTPTANQLPAALLAPFDPPEAKAIMASARDPGRRWYGVYANYNSPAYNTNLVKPADLPKTYEGFLEKKDWVGRVAIEGTDNERQLQAQAHIRGVTLAPDAFQEEGEMEDAIVVRHCDGVSACVSRIAQIRETYPKDLAKDKILPDILTLSPVAPAYRQDDPQWGMIVDWTIHALVQAEASGITQANLANQSESEDIVVQRLLGIDWATSRALGLQAHDWAAQVISVVGNYGEIYDRTVGQDGSLKLPRGLNALWLNGGLMHPLPIQ